MNKVYKINFSIKNNKDSGIHIDVIEYMVDKKCKTYIKAYTPKFKNEKRFKYDEFNVLRKSDMELNGYSCCVLTEDISDEIINLYKKKFEDYILSEIEKLKSEIFYLESNLSTNKEVILDKYFLD